MTKTQRRRAARQRVVDATGARDAEAPLDYAAASSLLTDHKRWELLNSDLRGLLEIEFTSPFIDTNLMCPEQAQLIVHLDPLRQPVSTTTHNRRRRAQPTLDLQQRTTRTLNAVVALCMTAKLLSPWEDLYHQFWRRINDSDAMGASLQAHSIEKWVRYTKAKGIPLLLSWSDKPFDPSQLMDPLRVFLATPQPAGCKGMDVPVTFGLRFVQATITTSVLERLSELLLQPTENLDALLVDPMSLRTLWLNSNPFYAPELSVLASALADPKARRIDVLRLENFVVIESPGTSDPAFNIALSQVVASAVTSKSKEDPPLSLSLAGNVLFADQIETVREAIAHATRPLCALSLASVKFPTWTSFLDLLFQPITATTPRATLDLSGVIFRDNISAGLNLLVRRSMESLLTAGAIGDQSVECYLGGGATLYHSPANQQPLGVPMPPGAFYTIEDFYPISNSLKITVPRSSSCSSEPVTGWVDLACVTALRRNGSPVVGTSFTRLVYDEIIDPHWLAVPTLVQFTSLLGSRLTGLSLRHYHAGRRWLSSLSLKTEEILSHCPHLEELSLEGTQVAVPDATYFWNKSTRVLLPTLKVLDLSRCGVRDTSLQGLQAFSLRYLSLLGNPIGTVGVESLLAMLRTDKRVEFIELNPQLSESPSVCKSHRHQIEELLRREYLQARDKAAVLSVLFHLQRISPRLVYPGNDIAALVFALVGTSPARVVKWSYY